MMKDKHGCLAVLFSYLAIPVVVAILVFAYFGAVDTFNGRRDARKAAEKAAADEEHWDIYNAGLVDEGNERYSEDYCKGYYTGYNRGFDSGLAARNNDEYSAGHEDGVSAGYNQGWEEGYQEGLDNALDVNSEEYYEHYEEIFIEQLYENPEWRADVERTLKETEGCFD